MKRKPKTPIDQPGPAVSSLPVPPKLKAVVSAIDGIPGHQTIGLGEGGHDPSILFTSEGTVPSNLGLFKIVACVEKVASVFEPPASPKFILQRSLPKRDGSFEKLFWLHLGSAEAIKSLVSLLNAPSHWKDASTVD